ncbi:MAG: AAA family ATPase [Candidatus Competibacteraceae bacterium]|jgi:SpoVK/Ycf46/Vps4 family AAA+-type ATPase|nr:AAA family ATPase [Candidatus Competibacteraceae bacterium]
MTLPSFLQAQSTHFIAPYEDDTSAYRVLLGRWLIDLALLLGWTRGESRRRHYVYPDCLDNGDFLLIMGLEDWAAKLMEQIDQDNKSYDIHRSRACVLKKLQRRRAALGRIKLNAGLPLVRNLGFLKELLGLSEAEQAVLCFALFLASDRSFLHAIAHQSQQVTLASFYRLLAIINGLKSDEIRAALHPTGTLLTTGLVTLGQRNSDLEDQLQARNDLPKILLVPHQDAEALATCFLKPSPKRTLNLANFPHLSRDTDVALGLLRSTLQNRLAGTNLLLYGPPGMGKTEYAGALADAMGSKVYEVDYEDADGNPTRGVERLRTFNLCQHLLSHWDNALLLFDEVEDVFDHNPLTKLFGGNHQAAGGKAWLNRTLENNPVPTLWLTNDARSMDQAYRRRFDYAIRFATPPRSVRAEIARYHLGPWAGHDDWLNRIAACEQLTPAQLERAAKLVRHAGNGELEADRALVLQALHRSAVLLGQLSATVNGVTPTAYDLRFLNIDHDIHKLIAALQRRPHGVFCFHGPAGTGKSELARYMADQLSKDVFVKRASDLLGMYVGQTEQRIATMFDEARQGDAVLVLDEADSFLNDRRGAQHIWEVTQVNELLTQMECFEGIFICTTNLMDTLDAASLRRFPWKIRFDYLKPAQRWALFVQEFVRLGGTLDQAVVYEDAVKALRCLTPGDVAVVVRQFELLGETPSAKAFYNRLSAELAAKDREPTSAKLAAPRAPALLYE